MALTFIPPPHSPTASDGPAGEQERRELKEDVSQECAKFGKICHLSLSRGSGSGAGLVHLKYVQVSSAVKAIEVLNGRFFGGRQVRETGCVAEGASPPLDDAHHNAS
jgi:hypothetical protein